MLVPMQRRVWVLAAVAAALVGCGGEKFTVATDQGVTDGTDSGSPGGVDTSCSRPSECELVAVECCGSCTVPGQPSQLTADQVIAMNRASAYEYRQSVCDNNDPYRCLDNCSNTVEVQGYQADCDNDGQCVIAESPPYGSP